MGRCRRYPLTVDVETFIVHCLQLLTHNFVAPTVQYFDGFVTSKNDGGVFLGVVVGRLSVRHDVAHHFQEASDFCF